jgi:hypothetical protein
MNLNLELLEKDIRFGLLKEEEIKLILKDHFEMENDLIKLSTFHPMDFISGNNYFEIKSRRFSHNKYKTTMVGKNKIEYAKKVCKDKNSFFIFVFEDGIYYYIYDINDNFLSTIGGRNDRGKDEYKLYYYIPINELIKIC